ncbi:MAG: hypothetical protein ACK4E7_06520 [Permianibacter sp.]
MNCQSLKTFFVLLLSTSVTAKSETFDTFVGGEICIPSGYAATDPAWGDDGNISVSIPSEMLKNIILEYDFSIARVKGIQNYGGDSWPTVHLFIYGKDYESEHMSTTNWLWSQYFSKKNSRLLV